MKSNQQYYCLRPWTVALAAAGLLTLPSGMQADPSTNAPTTLAGTPIGTKAKDSWWRRLDDAMRSDLGTPAYTPPAPLAPGATPPPQPNRRGNPTPFDSPPFPTGEWQIGGTPIIGDPNITPDYPFMESLYAGPHGQALSDSRIKFYGWEDFSGNISTSNNKGPNGNGVGANGDGNNFPEVYDQRSDRFEQNQFVLYLERTPDEFQTDHIDWGFRLSQVYGLDYRYMISRGWDSDQLLKHNAFYGTDNPMMYFNLYIPRIAEGLNLTFGRIISEADIEAQLAPNNLMSSHSLLYGYDPYCQWGLFGTLKLSKNWIVQGGVAAGNDVTPWETQDPGTQPTGTVMVQYQSDNNKFSFYGGGNAINNAQWGFNNIQQYVGTLTYKFNDKIWTSHETWYMYQEKCPGQTGGPGSTFGHPVPVTAPDEPLSQNGGLGYTDASIPVHPGYADEWATLNYTMFRLGPSCFLTIRNEAFDDNDGNRTGYACLYSEHSIGITWWPDKLITFRPEIRWDHAYGTHGSSIDPQDEAKPFDNGTRRNQFTAQFDVIYHF
jgi:hypothetical protein